MALFDPAVDWITDRVVRRLYGAGNSETHPTNSGHTVGPDTPFQLVAVRAAINVLSFDVGALPLKLYRKEGRGRTDETKHPLALAVHVRPNPRMTSQELREAIMVSLLTRGNFYGWLQRDASDRVEHIYPLRADRITVDIRDGEVVYGYTPANASVPDKTFVAHEILHIKGLSADGLVGRSPLTDFREKLGEIGAIERQTQAFFGNGMKRGAVLKHPKTLSKEAQDRLKQSAEEQTGPAKSWKVLVLEEGLDFTELTFSPEDAQMLETRRFSVEDVCRMYNLPAYKLRINEAGTVSYASVDAQHIDYLISSLTPYLVRIEQSIMRCCLSPEEIAAGYFVEHNTRALLRADLKSQMEALKIGREINAYSVNDCLEKLGENPSDDPRADDKFAPVQFTAQAKPASELSHAESEMGDPMQSRE